MNKGEENKKESLVVLLLLFRSIALFGVCGFVALCGKKQRIMTVWGISKVI
jgi:hypothetical protein